MSPTSPIALFHVPWPVLSWVSTSPMTSSVSPLGEGATSAPWYHLGGDFVPAGARQSLGVAPAHGTRRGCAAEAHRGEEQGVWGGMLQHVPLPAHPCSTATSRLFWATSLAWRPNAMGLPVPIFSPLRCPPCAGDTLVTSAGSWVAPGLSLSLSNHYWGWRGSILLLQP